MNLLESIESVITESEVKGLRVTNGALMDEILAHGTRLGGKFPWGVYHHKGIIYAVRYFKSDNAKGKMDTRFSTSAILHSMYMIRPEYISKFISSEDLPDALARLRIAKNKKY